MNTSVVRVPPKNKDFLGQCWSIKEAIRKDQDLLHQGKFFFNDTFVDGECFVAVAGKGDVIGFAVVLDDSYLALLGVDPECQNNGVGEDIMSEILEHHDCIRCHTRVTNDGAISFYKDLGFYMKDIESNYYENGENAAYLEYNESNKNSTSKS